MNVLRDFFKVFFLAVGVVWFLCGSLIVIFKLSFGMKEIILTPNKRRGADERRNKGRDNN